jgi:hypothetical protein
VDDDSLFAQHIRWTAEILEARAVSAAWLSGVLDLLTQQLDDFPRARRIVAAARRTDRHRPAERRGPADLRGIARSRTQGA